MDEKLIDDLYQRAVSMGYKKTRNDFMSLIKSDQEVFDDMFSYASGKGLTSDETQFGSMVGKFQAPYKKKDESGMVGLPEQIMQTKPQAPTGRGAQRLAAQQAPAMESPLAGGLSESQGVDERLVRGRRPEFVAESTAMPKPPALTIGQMEAKEAERKALLPEFAIPLVETITSKLVGKEEEDVVPQLNYQFGDLGFKFEESGMTGDYLKATAPNGQKIEISLDAFTSATRTKEADKLRRFITENTITIPQDRLSTIEKQYKDENKKFLTEEEVKAENKRFADEQESIKNEITEFNKLRDQVNDQEVFMKMAGGFFKTEAEQAKYLQNKKLLQERQAEIQSKIADYSSREAKLNKSLGKYYDMKGEQGTWYDAAVAAPIVGIGAIVSGIEGLSLDLINEFAPEDWIRSAEWWKQSYAELAEKDKVGGPEKDANGNVTKESYDKWWSSLSSDYKSELESRVRDRIKKEDKGIVLNEIRKAPFEVVAPTEEYIQDAKKSWLGAATLGALESIPAFLGGGAILRTAKLIGQTDDALMREMENDPDFKDVSENEKRLTTLPVSIVVAELEKLGFRNIIANKGLLNKLALSAIGKAGATTTAKTFGELVKYEVESGLARGVLTLVGGALAEAETGAAQQAAEYTAKNIYNAVKGKEMFNLPTTVGEYALEILNAGAMEAVGGILLGAPSAVAAASRAQGYLGMNDDTFNLFEEGANDPNIQTAYVNSLKNKVSSGEMTSEEAKAQLNEYRNAVSLLRSVPTDLSTEDKKKAMNLLRERRGLENQIEGKDPALVKPQQNRINTINQELTKLSEYAVQEQTAGEVPVQPTTGVSQQVAQGEPQAGPQVAAEEGVTAPLTEEKVITLQTITGTPEGGPRLRAVEDMTESEKTLESDAEAIAAEMNQMSAEEINFTEPDVSQKGLEVDPISESKSIVKPVVTAVKGLLKKIQDFNGIPMLMGMSDMLAAGKIKDSAGNDMDVEGGLLFNVLGKNKNAAWAGVTQEAAQTQYDNAVKLYNNNKDLFDRLWAEGRLPDGHIPMAIMRMADTAVNSNEATFRWVLPTVESLPEENRKSGMDAFISSMQEKLNTKESAKAQKVLDFIKSKNITTLDQFFKDIVADANARAKSPTQSSLNLDDRGYIYDAIFAPSGIKKASKPTVKALFNGVENPNTSVFLSDTVYDAIGEPSMRRMKQGEVASVVGIDVKNGGVVAVEHGNYGYGPKGQTIALISNPKHGMDVFPEFRAKASRVFKENVKGEMPSPEAVAQQTGGAFFTDKAFQGAKAMADAISDLSLLIGKLRFAFPSVSVSTTKEEFDNVVSQPDVRTRVSDGKVILGVTKDGKIYLNPDMVSLKTPIHEFGHIWIDFLRSEDSGKKGTDLLNRGLSLVRNTEEHKKAMEKYGDTDLALEEALVELMANKGATIVDAAKKSEFKSWMNAVFKYIKEKFSTFKDLDRKKISEMSLDEFINTGLADLFSGKAVGEKFEPSKAKEAQAPRMSQESKPVSELPGYDKLLRDVTDTLIPNAIKRKMAGQEMIDLVKRFVSKQDIYKVADDIQRDELVRQVNGMLGEAYKNAPSAQKILGLIQNPAKVTMNEKTALKKQIMDIARGAKDAKKAWMKATNELTKSIKDMVRGGKISIKQAAAVLRRFSGVNMFSEDSISKFVDYMSKVFADAEYADRIATIRKSLNQAKKNIESKIGISAELKPMLRQMLAINPNLIPDSVLDTYAELVQMFGERKAVLSLQDVRDVTRSTSQVLEAIRQQESLVFELKEMFEQFDQKVLDDDGKVMFSDTVTAMVDLGLITSAEAEVMKKYRSEIFPKEGAAPKTEAELRQEKDSLISSIVDAEVDPSTLPSRDERDAALKLSKLIKDSDVLDTLSVNDLQNLYRVIDLINNGYFPHIAEVMVEKLEAAKKSEPILDSLDKAKPLSLSQFVAKVKNLIAGGKRGVAATMIERLPMFYLDQVFGDFKSSALYNNIIKPISVAQAKFKKDYNDIQNNLNRAFAKVSSSFKDNPNKVTKSKFKMMTYLLELEYRSNPGSKSVASAMSFINKTAKAIQGGNTQYSDLDAEMLQDIASEFADETGNEIDIDALYDSFNESEKYAIKTIQEINKSLSDKAAYTANVIRGQKFVPVENYIHHSVIFTGSPMDDLANTSLIQAYNNSVTGSTRAKSLIERTDGAKPIDFDVESVVGYSAKGQLIDYYLTAPIRTARRTMNLVEKEMSSYPSEKRKLFQGINKSFERAVDNFLIDTIAESTLFDKFTELVSRQGYRAVLASVPRFISELTSNFSYVLAAGKKDFAAGVGIRDIVMSAAAPSIMRNLGSQQTNRVYSGDTLSGNMIDPSIMRQTMGTKGSKVKGDLANATAQIYNKLIKKPVKNPIEVVADTLISTPDKLIIRPLWFGAFRNEFKKITGSEPDFQKVEANDEAYMNENKEALDQATTKADQTSVFAGATDNPFMGILKGTTTRDSTVTAKIYNNFNNFMTRFLIYEYMTARTAVYALAGNGQITKQQATGLLAGVTSRMVVYSLLTNVLGNAMLGAVLGDDDEEDEKSFGQKVGQAMTSAFTSMFIGRDFGNAVKSIANIGVEKINEQYLDFLRNGDYDPYKDAIQYTVTPTGEQSKATDLGNLIANLSGSFGPALKTANLIVKKMTEPEKKEEEARRRTEQEIGVRIPLEVLGNLGFVPLYKDIRKIVLADIYKDMGKKSSASQTKESVEKYLLQGYDNRSDMQRYDPDLYEKTFGEGGLEDTMMPGNELQKQIKEEQKRLERAMKDQLYDYVPRSQKKKNVFGGGKFGESKFGGSSKSKGGFGSKKFGE